MLNCVIQTDYERTGNTYKQLVAWGKMDYENEFKFIGVSVQFKTCKRFKEYLHAKFKNVKIIVNIGNKFN